jgi:hypothetical protein
MTRAVVQNVGPPASSPVVGKEALMAVAAVVVLARVAAVDIATGKHARCTAPSVQTVATRHRFLFNLEKTDPSIATIATNRNVPSAQTTDDHAGNLYESGCAALLSRQ